jgi:HlyD family secretion protein
MNRSQVSILLCCCIALLACSQPSTQVLGTLERDRITLPAPIFERIADIRVREGDQVRAGDIVLVLESARSRARLDALAGEVARLQATLAEAQVGPRPEAIAEARARLRKVQSLALDARQDYQRVATIVERKLLPAAELDRVRAARDAADAEVAAIRSSLESLQNGTRSEQIVQAESALQSAQAQLASAQVDLDRTEIRSPRAGVVESLPYEIGDQPLQGAPLATLLVGDRPYARVYVPQPLLAQWRIGTVVEVAIAGEEKQRPGRVRVLHSAPSFTPYYALAGDDAARLSYLAEVELDSDDASLAVGMPLSARLPQTGKP